MDETRRTVTYGREILTTQVNFRENQKIHLIVTDTIKIGETIEDAYNRVKAFVDQKLVDNLTFIKTGESRAVEDAKTQKRRSMARTAATQMGLMFDDNSYDRD